MEKLQGMRLVLCGGLGSAGSLLTSLFGGWSSDMTTLVIFMGVDFLTGLIAAALSRSKKTEGGGLSSSVGMMGIAKKVMILLLVLVAHRVDLVLDIDYIQTAAVIAFIVNETISIIENAGLIGVPMPAVLLRAVELLRGKAEQDERN